MRRRSPTIPGVSLRGLRNSTTLPTGGPPESERHGSVGCSREKLYGCRGRRQQEDIGELAGIGEEQRSEHPCSSLGNRAHIPAATCPPFLDGFAPAPEFATNEVVTEDRPNRTSPRCEPKEDLTA